MLVGELLEPAGVVEEPAGVVPAGVVVAASVVDPAGVVPVEMGVDTEPVGLTVVPPPTPTQLVLLLPMTVAGPIMRAIIRSRASPSKASVRTRVLKVSKTVSDLESEENAYCWERQSVKMYT